MRRSKIVPASPTGFSREQDFTSPFPQAKQPKEQKISNSKIKSIIKKSHQEDDSTVSITSPPAHLPSSTPMLNGHHSQNGDHAMNGVDQIPEMYSPPLPLPPTPEPLCQVQTTGVKSPPPPTPPLEIAVNTQVQNQTVEPTGEIVTESSKEEKNAQKVQYYIIPSPVPLSEKDNRENSQQHKTTSKIILSTITFFIY